jgi:hypothetical protein
MPLPIAPVAPIVIQVPAEPPYGVGTWPEAGHGNHRALIRVPDGVGKFARVRIPWRRGDRDPEKKAVLVFEAATDKPVSNVRVLTVTREMGELLFEAIPGVREYAIYWLPYNPGRTNFDDAGTYFPPRDTASAALKAIDPKTVPLAELTLIQARTEHDRRDPMELIATEAEVAALRAAHPTAPYLVFPEDRTRSIRMERDLPRHWAQQGPQKAFAGEAQPGEVYPFQLGIWANKAALTNVRATLSALTRAGGSETVPAGTCLNHDGTDWRGRPITHPVAVPQGQVQALWLLVRVPLDAHPGVYRGTVTVSAKGAAPTTVPMAITVGGAALPDGGVSDSWRLSRLGWLNSTLAVDDTPLPPYAPLKVVGIRWVC